MTKQLSVASRAGSLLLALTMLSLAIFKAQACQSTPALPEPQQQHQTAPVEPAQQQQQGDKLPTPAAVDMAKPAQDMAADEGFEPKFLPATKSGAFMFKEPASTNKDK